MVRRVQQSPTKRRLLKELRGLKEPRYAVSTVLARWSDFAYACPAFVGLTAISQLAPINIKREVIVIPTPLHPFVGESFSG